VTTRSPFDPLKDAAKYIRVFRDKPFVVKIGGDILADAALRQSICGQIALLHSFAIPLVVVHGGSGAIDALCEQLKLTSHKLAGRRITSPEVLQASKMALRGCVQMDLLHAMQTAGLQAVGLSGQDARTVLSHRRAPVTLNGEAVDFGCVGDIDAVDTTLLRHLLAGGYVPVIAPFTVDANHDVLNTNADSVAAAIAIALGVQKLFFVVKVAGLLSHPDDASSLLPLADLEKIAALESNGVIRGGMLPKMAAAKSALAAGVGSVHIVSGILPDAILTEVFTNEGSGTMIVARS